MKTNFLTIPPRIKILQAKAIGKPLRAFHGSVMIQGFYVGRVDYHQKVDEIINGQYWENGKGCAVGCTLHSGKHAEYETELGIPVVLARLEDRLFEGIFVRSPEVAKAWPARFLKAAKPGADLSLIWPKFAHWLLVDETYGVIRFAKSERSREVIRGVGELYRQWCDGCKPAAELWRKARSAAYAAYAAAAYADGYADAAYAAAAYAAAAYAAAAYADGYADAAYAAAAYAAAAYADAAYAAAYAAAAYADGYADAAYAAAAYADAAYADGYAAAAYARKAHYLKMADKLIELMEVAQ